MKYKIGDKVTLINGNIMTIDQIDDISKWYRMRENPWNCYTDEMIEGLVEEEIANYSKVIDNGVSNPIIAKTSSATIDTYKGFYSYSDSDDNLEMEWNLPNGYIFKDENGNVINARKIVLEKEKKDISLTQEQIDTMVHESCVLFCKHCGCGVPRETCTSLGTCKEHDDYRKSIRTHFEKHKK